MEIANLPLDIQQLIWEAFVSALHERMGQTIFGTRNKPGPRQQTNRQPGMCFFYLLSSMPRRQLQAPQSPQWPHPAQMANC